MDIVW